MDEFVTTITAFVIGWILVSLAMALVGGRWFAINDRVDRCIRCKVALRVIGAPCNRDPIPYCRHCQDKSDDLARGFYED